MKKSFYLLAVSMLLLVSCKTPQLVSCGDVSRANDLPWLAAIVQKGSTTFDQKLVSIDKIVYSTADSETTYTGFDVLYESVCCDIPNEFIYNCDGEEIAFYGGIAGCSGECDLKILSRTNLYPGKNK